MRHRCVFSFLFLIVAMLGSVAQAQTPAPVTTRADQPRPQPILWLAIDDGRGARIVAQEAAAAVLPLTTRAAQSGVHVRLPDYDDKDRKLISTQDLVNGREGVIDMATRRYGGPALAGWMRRIEGGWQVNWWLRDGEQELARWENRDAQAVAVLAAGAKGLVDALTKRDTEIASSGPAGRYRVVFEGLRNAGDHAQVMQALQRQSIVRGVMPQSMDGDRFELELDLAAGVEGLARMLEGQGLRLVSLGDDTRPSVFAFGRR